MQKFSLDEIFESYREKVNDDKELIEKNSKDFDNIFPKLSNILSIDLQEEIFDWAMNHDFEMQKQSFIDGFKCATQLWKECEKE